MWHLTVYNYPVKSAEKVYSGLINNPACLFDLRDSIVDDIPYDSTTTYLMIEVANQFTGFIRKDTWERIYENNHLEWYESPSPSSSDDSDSQKKSACSIM